MICPSGKAVCNSGAPVLCGYLPVITLQRVGLHWLVVRYTLVKRIPEAASLSTFGVRSRRFGAFRTNG